MKEKHNSFPTKKRRRRKSYHPNSRRICQHIGNRTDVRIGCGRQRREQIFRLICTGFSLNKTEQLMLCTRVQCWIKPHIFPIHQTYCATNNSNDSKKWYSNDTYWDFGSAVWDDVWRVYYEKPCHTTEKKLKLSTKTITLN